MRLRVEASEYEAPYSRGFNCECECVNHSVFKVRLPTQKHICRLARYRPPTQLENNHSVLERARSERVPDYWRRPARDRGLIVRVFSRENERIAFRSWKTFSTARLILAKELQSERRVNLSIQESPNGGYT